MVIYRMLANFRRLQDTSKWQFPLIYSLQSLSVSLYFHPLTPPHPLGKKRLYICRGLHVVFMGIKIHSCVVFTHHLLSTALWAFVPKAVHFVVIVSLSLIR